MSIKVYIAIATHGAAVTLGAWVYAGQIAKRDLKLQKAMHAQAIADIQGEVSARDLQIEGLQQSQREGGQEIRQDASIYINENRTLRRENGALRDQLSAERTAYYEIKIPESSRNRLNCAFNRELCEPESAAASGAEDHNGYTNRSDQHSAELAGAPRPENESP